MYVFINENPKNKFVGDCAIRAISTAMRCGWFDTYLGVAIKGYTLCDMPSANRVWGDYLKDRGFKRHELTENCPECYTVKDFCTEHKRGTYILALSGHVIAVINGDYYDTWDSGNENPIYFWEREENLK